MIADLKPYAEYKESGLPWAGHAPGHWTVETLRRFLRSGDGIKIGPFGSQLKLAHMSESGFKVYGQANVIAGDIRRGSKYVDDAKFEQLRECEVRPGDLLVTMMGTSGRCMVVPEDAVAGLMDSHLLRLRLRANGVGPAFTALAIDQAPYVKQQVEVAGKGSIMQGLNSGMVKNLTLLIPPPAEQAAMVRFLDWANGRLERAIRAKRKVIALLGEQKQAIIHRAVTRGLDPSVPLKPSGIPWLGDIPQHWETPLFGRLLTGVEQGWSPVGAEGELALDQWAVLTLSAVRRGVFNPSAIKPVSLTATIPRGIEVDDGDVLLTRSNTRDRVGDVCIVRAPRARTILCDLIYRLRLRAGPIIPEFLIYQLLSRVGRGQIERDARGSSGTMPKISQGHIKSWRILLPPFVEQLRIVEGIDADSAPVNTAISRLEREIELLREYRTRLVADVVTGKLDVREAAARLPGEAGPDTAENDTDPSLDPEAADEETAA